MNQCGLFTVQPLDFISFNNLDIPCKEEVIISILELDSKESDSYTIRIPCLAVGPVSYDFKLAAYKVATESAPV